MTVLEIAAEYRQNAEKIRERMNELKKIKPASNMEKYRLRGRINQLRSLYDEARGTALYIERKYGNGTTKRKRTSTARSGCKKLAE